MPRGHPSQSLSELSAHVAAIPTETTALDEESATILDNVKELVGQ